MDEQGKTRADLARLLGLDSAQVTRIFNDERKIQRHEMQKIEAWLGQRFEPEGAMILAGPGMVPLYGLVGASSENRLTIAEQNLLGVVPMHPAQANLRSPFALQVDDVSMSPRYEMGEIAYLAPHRRPRAGEDCVIVTRGDYGYLKRFVKMDDEKIYCEQLNPPKQVIFKRSDVIALHTVVGRN